MALLEKKQKLCFVTVGATAPFDALVAEVLSEAFIRKLSELKYTQLLIQFGRCSAPIRHRLQEAKHYCSSSDQWSLSVQGYDFKDSIEADLMKVKHAPLELVQEGVVLSHAVMRLGVPLIVVPNPDLMNNHQDELAHALSKENYVLHGRLGILADVIREELDLRVE
ncbi:N-acetylglucosaminyldiphosphodolichol N-acetylglucosaminyltransferase catalytic subunit alg13 [Ascosphaera aggregata]|nr:N-acetylglucosaminyldiphosphodolichol N-acetylglucosaminyltransferase catalytic subunit alg13 [Ascosphaera aggregata]